MNCGSIVILGLSMGQQSGLGYIKLSQKKLFGLCWLSDTPYPGGDSHEATGRWPRGKKLARQGVAILKCFFQPLTTFLWPQLWAATHGLFLVTDNLGRSSQNSPSYMLLCFDWISNPQSKERVPGPNYCLEPPPRGSPSHNTHVFLQSLANYYLKLSVFIQMLSFHL